MIGIDGQWIFDLADENQKSLIKVKDLQSFVAIEECGLLLPVFKISFILNDIKSLSYMNEGAILKVALGKNIKDLKYINLQILQVSESTNDAKIIYLTATLYKPTYSKTSKCKVYSNKTSVELLKQIISQYFEIISNTSISTDRKDWTQFGISDKNFVEYLWFNSHIDNGFLSLGCSAIENKFIIKDIVKSFTSASYDYKMGYTKTEDKDLLISAISGSAGNYGFYNTWAANDTTILNFNPSTNSFFTKECKMNTLLSTTDKNSKNTKIEKNINKISLHANNNYAQAKVYNMFALSNYSKYSLEVTTIGEFNPIKLLDKIYLDLNKETKGNEEYFSGNYLVTRVVRIIQDNAVATKITISRESPGNIKGADL